MHAGSDNSSNYIGKKDEERGIVRIHFIAQWYCVCFQKNQWSSTLNNFMKLDGSTKKPNFDSEIFALCT